MAYPKTEPKANFSEIEHNMLNFWRTDNTFHKSLNQTKNGATFNFYDGPPFANNLPHWGHLGVSAVKDMVSRYQTMQGKYVPRELGWDCHGVPAEASVEKKQGLPAKDIVARDGIAAFCDMCKNDVLTYSNEWIRFIERIGRWVDGGNDCGYRTMDKNYMESVIWALGELYKKGLLYKDYRVNPYDWKLGTVLSNSEASSEYQDSVDDAITVWFELESGDRIMAWTTTPWTLPANSALAVNPNMQYARLRDADGNTYIIAESRQSAYEKQLSECEKIESISGADLIGKKYTPLFPYYENTSDLLYKIIPADYVSDGDGTGVVHIAPAYGEDDFWAAKNIDPKFPIILNVDDYGNFTDEVGEFAGKNIFDANKDIILKLRESGHLVKKEQYKHSYPYGPRSHEKLIYRATDSWYIDVPKIRERLIQITKEQTCWTSAGDRFLSWIEGARPWSVSRNRFWGTPLPIWEKNGEYKIFGSVAEIENFFGEKIQDLHRPTLDKLTIDGWVRIPDVLDCWVESGSMPFAALHYPFENKDVFESNFPADYIIEGQDQTRGWFYSLMVMATALFDKAAFKTVTANGMLLDEHKKKMSKSLGNFTNPAEQIENCGADAVRLFILGSNFLKGESVCVDKAGTVFNEPIKTILTPLWNAYHFFTLYANAGNITATDDMQLDNPLDKYITAEINELVIKTKNALDAYTPDAGIKEIIKFLDVLNNWYIRRSRTRFWDEDQNAFNVLFFALKQLCLILAPFAPFASDYIYKNLTGAESVHLEKFPIATDTAHEVLNDMRRVQATVSVAKQLREQFKLRNRLPLAKLTVAGADLSAYANIIKDELNVKSVEFTKSIEEIADSFVYLITPKIGARLGGALKDIIPAVKRGEYVIKGTSLTTMQYTLNADEFESRLNVKSGITGAALPDNTAVIIIDTEINSELIAEGLANDALRFIQDTRKTTGMDVSDRIIVEYSADPAMANAIDAHKSRIMRDALITELNIGAGEYSTEIEGYNLSVSVRKK